VSGGPRATDRRTAMWLALPAVALLLLVAGVPLLSAVRLSLHRHILVFGERHFVGLANYATLAVDERFRDALRNTVAFTAGAVALELLLAIPLALLLHRAFAGRALARAAVLVPWAIPTVVAAKLWAWIFDPAFGLARHFPGEGVLSSPHTALAAAVVVDVWKTTPFVALLLLAGLQSIPEDVFRAARVDGASAWRTFRRVTLPLLMPSIRIAVLFRALDAFRVFDAVWVLTGGGPANSTETLSVYAYKTLVRAGDFGYGSTLAVATFVCMALLAAAWLATASRREDLA
jgi:multiple sugar transport system permease protein